MIKATMVEDKDQYKFDEIISIFGGMPEAPKWRRYLGMFKKEFRTYLVSIKNCIIDNNLIGARSNEIANDYLFEFSDGGKPVAFSWRGWGDFMQAVVGKKEGYMEYYM